MKLSQVFINFNFFDNDSDFSNITSSNIESKMGYLLWNKHCYQVEIKDLTSIIYNYCEYTWKIVLYIIIIDVGYEGPNI